jgi:hypothetical protein
MNFAFIKVKTKKKPFVLNNKKMAKKRILFKKNRVKYTNQGNQTYSQEERLKILGCKSRFKRPIRICDSEFWAIAAAKLLREIRKWAKK